MRSFFSGLIPVSPLLPVMRCVFSAITLSVMSADAGAWHFIDHSGRDAFGVRYRGVSSFTNGVAAVCVPPRNYLLVIGRDGKPVSTNLWCEIGEYSNGFASVSPRCAEEGYCDARGMVVLPAKYAHAQLVRAGIAVVRERLTGSTPAKDNALRLGSLEPPGSGPSPRRESPPSSTPRIFSTAFSVASWQPILNVTGRLEVITSNLIAICREGQDKWVIRDLSSGIDVATDLDEIWTAYCGVALFVRGGQTGYLDGKGKEVVGAVYDEGLMFSDDVAWVRKGQTWQLIDTNGTVVIKSAKADDIASFSEGLCGFQMEGKWGFMDKQGRVAIPPRFKCVQKFSEGLAPIMTTNLWGYIDRQGRVVIPEVFISAEPFAEGLAAVEGGSPDNARQNEKHLQTTKMMSGAAEFHVRSAER